MLRTLSASISNRQALSDSTSISRLWAASTGLIRFAFRTLRELLHPPWDAEEISRQLYEIAAHYCSQPEGQPGVIVLCQHHR